MPVRLTKLELHIMEALWDRGPASAEIQEESSPSRRARPTPPSKRRCTGWRRNGRSSARGRSATPISSKR